MIFSFIKEAIANLETSNEKIKIAKLEEGDIIADLHIHSRYSRATSKYIDIPNLVKWARIKGLNLLGTGDFTHPKWIEELRIQLNGKNGVYWFKDEKGEFPFILTGEISLIYTHNGKGRKVHLVMLAPSFEIADKINAYLDAKHFRRDYDGRPIFGISCENFTKDILAISDKIEIIPAHCMTPFFGVFGSESGYDSLKEAFGNQYENIHAIESGMSADPEMLWKLDFLENKAIVSFSDAHSFWSWRLGREATIFFSELGKELSYNMFIEQIRNKTYKATIETEPGYGKYHFDGHRDCKFSCSPKKTKELGGICPVCNKPLVIGVENRVEELENFKGIPSNAKMFYKILPLHELIAFSIGSKVESKKTWLIYNELIAKFGNELNILLKIDKNVLMKELANNEKLMELIIDNRIANLKIEPGYDGTYGKIVLK